MAMYYNGKKVRNLYYNGKCITRLALGKEMTRLVEGDDFVRAEWLKGDGTAYIDTLHLANEGLDWETHVSNLSFKKYFVWNRVISGETPSITLYHSSATNGTVRVQNNYTNSIELQNQINYDYIVATNSNGVVVNGVQYIGQSASENISNKSIKLFYCDIDEWSKELTVIPYGGNSQDVKCAYFRFIDANGTTIQNLVPVRLLRPIPASLDGNGIARNAGECGMFDAVSGKFYGNVGSGAFTVEPSLVEGVDYERHRWLVGDGNAYIDTKITEVNQNIITLNAIIDVSIYNQALFGAEDTTVSPYKRVFVRYSVNKLIVYDNNPSRQVATDAIVNLVFSDDGNVYLNGDEVTTYSSPLSLTDSVLLFAAFLRNSQGTSIQNSTNMKVSHFSISNIIDLSPVRLLRPLPSYLDANGKARHQFECGMLDLKTMKFYGNVNTSGNFSVSDN